MQSTKQSSILPLLLLIFTSQTLSQTLPGCWQECIKTDLPGCADTNLDCICSSASSPNNLSPLINCISTSCASSAEQTFGPLQSACRFSSSPLPSSLISSLIKSLTTDVAHPTILLASPTSFPPIHTSTIASTAATSSPKQGGDGTVLNLEGGGRKREQGCLLGLTVGILAGIAWF